MEGCCMTILLWLFVFTSSCLAAHDALCSRHEAEALLKFKNSLSTTNRCDPYTFGSNICDRFHPKMNSWKEERANDCCSWDGITCDSVTGHVIGLDLSFSGISAKFPPNSTLFELLHLQNLNLAYNDFNQSEISANFGQLLSLKHLNLSVANFTGHIPSTISHLSKLVALDLSLNDGLRVESNTMKRIVENLTQMFSSMQYLRYLHLSKSGLSISTPKQDQNFTMSCQFDSLDLSFCNLTEFPEWLRSQNDLTSLHLSNNKIKGQIPNWMWNVSRDKLQYLDLSYNFLTGNLKFPWKMLAYLNVKSNLLEGPLPRPIASRNSLQPWFVGTILDLSHNFFSGTIQSWYWNMRQVSVLNLENNNFHGTIPENLFTEECGLNSLNLNGNQLEGELARSIQKCRKLEVIDVGNNHINDTFPSWLDTLPELQVLILRSNNFHGAIRQSKTNHSFPKLKVLDVSNNNFSGNLPAKYINCFKSMMEVDGTDQDRSSYMGERGGYYYSMSVVLKGNEMEFQKILNTFTTIDLSRNNFHGSIPNVIGNLILLKGLNLSHNNLSGRIPSSVGKLSNLESLDLSSNKLNGEIPRQLVDLNFLEVLNLSENKLVGPIPKGKQFDTFANSSYEGNRGLCGLPLSKSCKNKTITPASSEEENEDEEDSLFGLGWKIVAIGYGCGTIVGIVIGYLVFWRWKPTWFVMIFGVHRNAKQSKKKTQRQSGATN